MTNLVAHYQSPDSTHSMSLPLPTAASDSTEAKTAYLTALRSNITQLQADVNAFLTKKMEQDKAAESGNHSISKDDELKEEDMYGEEDPEADG